MLQFSKALLNGFVPEIDDFEVAEIQDVFSEAEEAGHWMANHFLNTAFSGRFQPPTAQLVANLIYRTESFFFGYRDARTLTMEFLALRRPGNPGLGRYLRALRAWEGAFLDLQIAMDLVKSLTEAKPFSKGDGSAEQRAYDIANAIKHCASSIARGTHPAPLTVPMWLRNTGFETAGLSLTFSELATLARELQEWADALQSPQQFAEKQGLTA